MANWFPPIAVGAAQPRVGRGTVTRAGAVRTAVLREPAVARPWATGTVAA